VLTLVCAVVAITTYFGSCWICYRAGHWVGYARKLLADEGFGFGKAEGYRLGITEGENERDELRTERDKLREQFAEASDVLDATMLRFEEYVEDHANTYPPTTWSDTGPPGGQVCAVRVPGKPGGICGTPVESEPCPEHTCACAQVPIESLESK
jgi:hypothetical protein